MSHNYTFLAKIITFFITLVPVMGEQQLYVLNSLAETVSYWNGTTIFNDAATLGLYPNDMRVLGDTLLVLNSGSHNLQILDRFSYAALGNIALPVNSNPYEMTRTGGHYLFATLLQSNQLARIDLNLNSVTDTVSTGPSPEGLLVVDDKIFVTSSSFNWDDWSYGQGKIIVHNLETLAIEAEILVPTNPQKVILATDGLLHALCTGDYFSTFGKVVRINPATLAVIDTLELGGSPGAMTLDGDGVVFIAAGGWGTEPAGLVYTYAVNEFTLLHGSDNPLTVGHGIMSVSADPHASGAWVASFDTDQIIHITAAGEITNQVTVGDGPSKIALVPEGTSAVTDTQEIPGTFSVGQAYPNPFNPSTTFEISLKQPARVMINIVNLKGQPVTQLVSSDFTPGVYVFQWDGETVQHLPAASGIYFLETIVNQDRTLQKITLAR